MWVATTDIEANLVFDLLAERDANEPVLKYAHWLESRGENRAAEFLRLELEPDEDRLNVLRQELDARWLNTVTSRHFRAGDAVRVTAGLFAGMEGSIVGVDARKGRAGLLLHIFYRPTELTWVPFEDLSVVKRAEMQEDQK